MSGSVTGGKKAAIAKKELYGKDFYRKIGSQGGKAGGTGGFYYSKANGLDTHIEAGRKGGTVSRRAKAA
jgi:general stress protein YciG